MPRDFYPRREADIAGWTSVFSSKINLSPQDLGLSVEQAQQYALTQQAFASLYATANSPSTRTPSVIQAKNDAAKVLEAQTRTLAAIIRSQPTLTSEMRVDLRLPLRNPGGGGARRILAKDAPHLHLRSTVGRTLLLSLSQAHTLKRSRPHGAEGASFMFFVGDHTPGNLLHWKFLGHTAHCDVRVNVPASIEPGAKLWLTAQWIGRGSQISAPSTPLCVRVPEGVASSAIAGRIISPLRRMAA